MVMKSKMFSTLALFLIIVVLSDCSSNSTVTPAVDCGAISKKLSDALALYVNSPTSANCKAYVAAANEYLNKAGSCGVPAADIASAKQSLNATTCP
jgi:hypothetical protein